MRFFHAQILALLLGSPLAAAPPKLELPAEVKGDVGAFVTIPAETEGKNVSWLVLDPGLNMFPIELLKDTKTAVVTSAKSGRYRVIAVTAAGDEVSQFAQTLVIIGNAAQPPPVDPPKDPPDDPVAGLYFACVRQDGPVQLPFHNAMLLPAWRDIQAKGHVVRDFTLTEAKARGITPAKALPVVVTLRKNAAGGYDVVSTDPLPTTNDGVLKLPELGK